MTAVAIDPELQLFVDGVAAAEGLAEAARESGVRVLGPGSFGVAVPAIGLNASRSHLTPLAGKIARGRDLPQRLTWPESGTCRQRG